MRQERIRNKNKKSFQFLCKKLFLKSEIKKFVSLEIYKEY